MNTPSERFKAVRKELGLTQNEFARELGISQVAVYKLEEGQIKSISQEVTQILEEKFGINKIWLHFGEGMMYLDDTTNMYSVYNKLEYLSKLVENVLSRLGGSAPVLSEKRGRGRPRKSSVISGFESDSEGTMKRGPGRPRKNPVSITSNERRGPGRPRKNPIETIASGEKRGPGRPRKSPVNATSNEKRGPGRPRKNVVTTIVAKRTPGRPRIKPLEETTLKRTPGRPRKSPVVSATELKRTPGRPRKNPVTNTQSEKRSPGRPRKSQPEVTATVKRSPGRPAKTSAPQGKRGPGRPKKS